MNAHWAQNYSQGSKWRIEKVIFRRPYLGLRFNHNRESSIPLSSFTKENVQTSNKNTVERGTSEEQERTKRNSLRQSRKRRPNGHWSPNSHLKHQAPLKKYEPLRTLRVTIATKKPQTQPTAHDITSDSHSKDLREGKMCPFPGIKNYLPQSLLSYTRHPAFPKYYAVYEKERKTDKEEPSLEQDLAMTQIQNYMTGNFKIMVKGSKQKSRQHARLNE